MKPKMSLAQFGGSSSSPMQSPVMATTWDLRLECAGLADIADGNKPSVPRALSCNWPDHKTRHSKAQDPAAGCKPSHSSRDSRLTRVWEFWLDNSCLNSPKYVQNPPEPSSHLRSIDEVHHDGHYPGFAEALQNLHEMKETVRTCQNPQIP